ncbi:5-methyltetrahydropteroyltriglutamate--homocysteine S-methyltransferase [Acidiphilium sp. AL]|uniref:5-methyltetrahydropteroyltriglutamate--homocysteine methyltransferase n=1 Tax=Acidiphilium iwatense TaxID=768198 RepID=A0ABS9DX42_9PROT|nr:MULTISPECIES: 5-methyltetrahydropteroyltriglutamate--homocysteine S-methyltransferase [Acidiphilium]MCF3947244.1 5-methyltetrahydropteroyltriglutamate--homocysteine S-methyltransferase [Acidiphilium iwatense]MCU4159742.1 5-methyltetrahydropteroyltriglutamate--homocysteine S-methyltransferase [Acidiphilium sp. AL]
MTVASNLGFPRIGHRRALKTALEAHWAGKSGEAALLREAAALREAHWRHQHGAGLAHIPSGEFSLYDHVLDTATMLGAVPAGYGWDGGGPVSLATYFALARGNAEKPALEMTKWFDTNYHYLVPLLARDQRFVLTENRPLASFREAASSGLRTRPVLLGPVSFLRLAKTTDGSDPLDLLDALVPVYARILRELAEAGAVMVQIDEPVLALDLPARARDAFARAYGALAKAGPELLLASYFGPIGDNLPTVLGLPVAGLHLDLCRGSLDLGPVLEQARPDLALSLGLVNGRNIWRADLRACLATAQRVAEARDARLLMIAPSCSLLHVPLDLAEETGLPAELAGNLAFAMQKLVEIKLIARGLDEGEAAIAAALDESDAAIAARAASDSVHNKAVASRLAEATDAMTRRRSAFPVRRVAQRSALDLPRFPTTTIGSFPQTTEVRRARAAHAKGAIDDAAYDAAIETWTREAISWQEAIGLDVLVHGEFERNDMVQYFGERLAGFAFTRHGWVQSYGSRCVAPPIIWADVSRPAPMTVRWARFAQSLTEKPVKGMLTGPVTVLQWSFVREDIPRETTCRQIALALRDEVADLEDAGIRVIQIDEPALREGLPLRAAERDAYLAWAVDCFRLSASPVRDATQIHTHMCYADFEDILDAIAALDADVISIEATRSRMALLEAFEKRNYPNEIGPGVWDIHSPRVPEAAEMAALLERAAARLDPDRLWVNPDCGLKTRRWDEVRPALENMVAAARRLRAATHST